MTILLSLYNLITLGSAGGGGGKGRRRKRKTEDEMPSMTPSTTSKVGTIYVKHIYIFIYK